MTGGGADHTVAHRDAWLLGEWQVLRCEPPLEIQPGTRMHFRVPDELEYTIPAGERTLMTTLRWRMEGAALRTLAAEHGWTHEAQDVDYCPPCSKTPNVVLTGAPR